VVLQNSEVYHLFSLHQIKKILSKNSLKLDEFALNILTPGKREFELIRDKLPNLEEFYYEVPPHW
jgi:hypothetical protein